MASGSSAGLSVERSTWEICAENGGHTVLLRLVEVFGPLLLPILPPDRPLRLLGMGEGWFLSFFHAISLLASTSRFHHALRLRLPQRCEELADSSDIFSLDPVDVAVQRAGIRQWGPGCKKFEEIRG